MRGFRSRRPAGANRGLIDAPRTMEEWAATVREDVERAVSRHPQHTPRQHPPSPSHGGGTRQPGSAWYTAPSNTLGRGAQTPRIPSESDPEAALALVDDLLSAHLAEAEGMDAGGAHGAELAGEPWHTRCPSLWADDGGESAPARLHDLEHAQHEQRDSSHDWPPLQRASSVPTAVTETPASLTDFSDWLVDPRNLHLAQELVPDWQSLSWRARLNALQATSGWQEALHSRSDSDGSGQLPQSEALSVPIHPSMLSRRRAEPAPSIDTVPQVDFWQHRGFMAASAGDTATSAVAEGSDAGAGKSAALLSLEELLPVPVNAEVPYCCVCMEQWSARVPPAVHAFTRCGHGEQLCWTCAAQLDICPLCRRPG